MEPCVGILWACVVTSGLSHPQHQAPGKSLCRARGAKPFLQIKGELHAKNARYETEDTHQQPELDNGQGLIELGPSSDVLASRKEQQQCEVEGYTPRFELSGAIASLPTAHVRRKSV